jgi:hypothetical protein
MINIEITSDFDFINKEAEIILEIQKIARKIFLSELKSRKNLQLVERNVDNISIFSTDSLNDALKRYGYLDEILLNRLKLIFNSALRDYSKFEKNHLNFIIELAKESVYRFEIERFQKKQIILNKKK